jgi:hypothetical protein
VLPSTICTVSAPKIGLFRGSMAGLCAPLSTLRRDPRGPLRMTRGRCGSLLLHRKGLAPSTPCRSPGASQMFSALPPKAGLPDLRTTLAANSSRTPPSPPRASPRALRGRAVLVMLEGERPHPGLPHRHCRSLHDTAWLPRALDRLDIVHPAAVPMRSEPWTVRCGEMVE